MQNTEKLVVNPMQTKNTVERASGTDNIKTGAGQ